MMMLAKPCSAAGWDTGTSQNLFIRMALNDSWFATSRNNLATRDGFGDKFFWYTDLSLGNRLSERWSGELGYRHAQLKLSSGWRIERRPLINVAWRDRIADWTVSNRHRVEFRFFDGDANDRVRYRNETRFTVPKHLSLFGFRPYVEEELFYELTDDGFNLNWLGGGVEYELAKKLRVKVGYRWQAQKFDERWEHRHVLVSGLVWFL